MQIQRENKLKEHANSKSHKKNGKNGDKNMNQYETVTHTFAPVWNKHSKILILGTFPSVKSREMQFYYGHPQNRFWKMLAQIYKESVPSSIEEKKRLILNHELAIWDVIAKCDILGSSDSSIRNVVINNIAGLVEKSQIHTIVANGAKAFELYEKYQLKHTGIPAKKLPSTSPANAAWKLERLVKEWGDALISNR